VPTWAWAVMAAEALAIVALIFLLVRERDLRALSEQRLSDQGPHPPAPGYGSQGPGYVDPESEYPTQSFDPRGPGSGRGGQPPGSDRPRS
jgi:hypothetical protein